VSWPGHPHIYLQVRRREHYSQELQSGMVHVTLKIGTDETGPSEIGGLILGPSYRGHKDRLGLQLSLVRFHWIGLHREWFADRIIAEMMGALTPDSRNLLWEYLGRRFVNLDYTEADRFSQQSKEFILSLFPKTEIYASLLPAVARNLIGRVGPETEPARLMLEKLGFEYHGHVDPFDGGPYLEARLPELEPVRTTQAFPLVAPVASFPESGFLSSQGQKGFRAVRGDYALVREGISIPAETADLIGAAPGDTIGVTPFQPDGARTRKTRKRSRLSKGHEAPA
jgi:arginine N-succinyltransferase